MLTCSKIVARNLKLKPSGLRAVRLASYSSKVLKSPYGEVEVPNQTLSQFVFSKAANWPDLPALDLILNSSSADWSNDDSDATIQNINRNNNSNEEINIVSDDDSIQNSSLPTLMQFDSSSLSEERQCASENMFMDRFPSSSNGSLQTCGLTGRSYTYGTMEKLCQVGAQSLLAETGLRPGDRVGLLLPNIPEYLVAVHASLRAGLVVTFANPLYTEHELGRQFRNARVRCIVTVPQLLETGLAVARQLEDYDCTINVGGEHRPEQKVLGLDRLLRGPGRSVDLPELDPSGLAVLPYSSGTTGVPKGVMLSHRCLVTNIVQLAHPELVRNTDARTDQKTILTVLPFFHIYGFNTILNYLAYFGMHVVTMPRFTPQDYLACLRKYRPDVLFVVPSLLLFLVSHPEVAASHLSSVETVFCGAAPMKKKLIDHFYRKIGREDCVVSQGYGMTETSPGVTLAPYDMPASKRDSCGRLLPSTQARVVDLASGRDVDGPNQPGELLVKGPQLMQGYLDNPEATREVIDPEGWLHTGDVVYYDEDQYFYIVDRTKELIKVKGNQVSPTELESLILEIPGVADAAVIGIPDPIAGELPKAYVVRKPGSDLTSDQVQDFVAPKVATYKKLAGGVSFIEAIPRNPSGKILRNELKNLSS